ncbi:DUF262 domain-containing protein [candidate division WOR-3 bacterium]|nr:DUF262 domain-containing protein [candidate division WOR-3 bacterium]
MAYWINHEISKVIELIEKEDFVLPVIQRKLVWDEEHITLLFDTILKGDSFGAIMTLKDIKGTKPLFEFRPFDKDFVEGKNILSTRVDKITKHISYVIDGQQRLYAIYIGLTGSYNSRYLYFDLLSEWDKDDFYLQFALDKNMELKSRVDAADGNGTRRTFWYRVKDLYSQLASAGNPHQRVVQQIFDDYHEENFTDDEKESIKKNVENFAQQFFSCKNIGICEVLLNTEKDIYYNRRKTVELFRRLNQSGTKLDASELIASVLKSFTADNEEFLYEDINEFLDLNLGQDEIIKLIFILQDNHRKELLDVEQQDSDFIQKNRDRILNSIRGTKQFLIASRLYNFFKDYRPSVIPLYFIAYHLFHKTEINIDSLKDYFNNVEDNEDYKLIYKWIYLSLLNGVFRRRGAGWTAYKTGIRKILEVMKEHKNKEFPVDKLFKMYIDYPLSFDDNIREDKLDSYDFSFLMYIIYERCSKFREEDIDHIHPYAILEKIGLSPDGINTVANKQLLDRGTNRGNKSNKELKDWINSLNNKEHYLKRHLIPQKEELWMSCNYQKFIKERRALIKNKLVQELR